MKGALLRHHVAVVLVPPAAAGGGGGGGGGERMPWSGGRVQRATVVGRGALVNVVVGVSRGALHVVAPRRRRRRPDARHVRFGRRVHHLSFQNPITNIKI